MSDYSAGSLKLDPLTGRVAVRTRYAEVGPLIGHAWCVASPDDGGANRSSADIATWIDIPKDVIDTIVSAHNTFAAGS